MSPSVHRADKDKLLIRWEKQYKELVKKLMEQEGDANMTELMKRLVEEEAKRKGLV